MRPSFATFPVPHYSPFQGSRTRFRICEGLALDNRLNKGTDDRNRFLEDFINLVGYRPTANFGGKKQHDEDLQADREEYLSVGLDERGATAVQAISRTDRVDYTVSLHLDVQQGSPHQ
jgi:hypothetical protein